MNVLKSNLLLNFCTKKHLLADTRFSTRLKNHITMINNDIFLSVVREDLEHRGNIGDKRESGNIFANCIGGGVYLLVISAVIVC
ncbi:Uncharacterised protein [Klebsiella variicola]|uniref:Uncharacterized protein n=1 Tax=Klebsiella variicola TaxID=244366 RepID=A0A7H4MMD7_KLEVA|nr:Uncharacterised protein [Klebsiella variicola]